jgi:hypothetical protein
MVQTNLHRRSPCGRCGGRYFASHFAPLAVLVAVIAFLGGIAMTVVRGGVGKALSTNHPPRFDLVVDNVYWAVGGVVVAVVVAVIGHSYRCVSCDTPR